MQIELNDGTTVRFLNGGSLQKAAYDFNCGSNVEEHLHVYLSCSNGFTFMCSERSLCADERREAEQLVQEHIAATNAETRTTPAALMANTDDIIQKMQGSIPDKSDAPVNVRRAVGFDPQDRSLRSWADVKAQIILLAHPTCHAKKRRDCINKANRGSPVVRATAENKLQAVRCERNPPRARICVSAH